MTPDELRALAAERTSWQWNALAPQLALLCAEMAEAIKGATEWTNREAWDKKEAALASLKALEKP